MTSVKQGIAAHFLFVRFFIHFIKFSCSKLRRGYVTMRKYNNANDNPSSFFIHTLLHDAYFFLQTYKCMVRV